MGLLQNLFGKKQLHVQEQERERATAGFEKITLKEDIVIATEWVVKALQSSGYKADYSLESMKEIDRFFTEQHTPDGILTKHRGKILFALGCYIGETAIRTYGGTWMTNEEDPQGEMNIQVMLDIGCIIFPVQRAMKRYQFGEEESIYAYLYVLGVGD